jgi:hypothetical protein
LHRHDLGDRRANRAPRMAVPILLHGGVVRCPFNHRWMIGHHIEDVAPEEMQRRYTKLLAGS